MRYLPPLSRDFKGLVAAGGIAVALCGFFAVFGSRGVLDLRRIQAQQAEIEAIAFDLAQKNQRLRDHIERLEHDDRYLEKIARERLGWIKPGELVYRTAGRSPQPPIAD